MDDRAAAPPRSTGDGSIPGRDEVESPAGRRRAWIALAAYALLFALLLGRLLVESTTAFGRGNNPVDSRLLAWTQAAVARRLVENPSRLFDAPIFHPATQQLAGAESFLSSQIVFAPVFWLSGNAVLAANLLVALSYPLAAFAMERLLAALGVGALVAWVAGALFALGPLAVPANIQLTQYLIVYLPLIALTLRRLRDQPSWRRAIVFAGTYLLAVFSSFYMAALATLVALGWAALEVFRGRDDRLRFTVRVVVAMGGVVVLLGIFSRPYLERRRAAEDVFRLRTIARAQAPEGVVPPDRAQVRSGSPQHTLDESRSAGPIESAPSRSPSPRSPSPSQPYDRPSSEAIEARGGWSIPLWLRFSWPPLVDVSLLLAMVGLGALGSSSPIARRVAVAGALMAALGTGALALFLSGALTPLPRPVAFFRNPFRWTAVTGFGVALLGAAALEAARQRLGSRPGNGLALLVLGAVLATRGKSLVSATLDPVDALARDATAYREIGSFASSRGGGPLLELPAGGPQRDELFTDAMVASTLHGLPLVEGFGPVFPLHWPLVSRAIDELPAPDALQELVDLTGVKWVLLRPVAAWPHDGSRQEIAERLARAGAIRLESGGFLLQRLDLEPRHPEWARAIARGFRSGESLLGTPYSSLTPGDLAGTVAAPARAGAVAEGLLDLPVDIANRGSATWPGALSGNGGAPGEVFLAARWRRSPAGEDPSQAGEGPSTSVSTTAFAGIDVGLRRDLPPGEALRQVLRLPVPSVDAGSYVLELRLGQRGRDGAAMLADGRAVVAVSVRSRGSSGSAARAPTPSVRG